MTEYVDFALSDLVFFKLKKKNVDSAFLFSFTRLGYQKQTMFFNPCLSIWQIGSCDQPWRPVISQTNLRFFVLIHKLYEQHLGLIRKFFNQDFIEDWKIIYHLDIYLWWKISWVDKNNFIVNNLNSYTFEQKSYIDIEMTVIYKKANTFEFIFNQKGRTQPKTAC